MGTYCMTADNIFLDCPTETEIDVFKITSDSVISRDFKGKVVAKIGVTGDSKYNELSVNGVVIRGQQLKDLASDLFKSRLKVNRQGYCYLFVGPATFNLEAFGIVRYRLNDLFGWSKYGVVPSVTTMWDKCDLHTKIPVINLTEQQKLLGDYKSQMREKDQELYHLKKRLEEKDQELTDYKLKLTAAEKELIRFKEKNKELKDRIKVNDWKLSLEKNLQERIKELEDWKMKLEERDEELSLSKDKSRVDALGLH